MDDTTSFEFPTLDQYYADFAERFWIPGSRFWKFERGQHYAEPGNPSWTAFNQGNWAKALELLETDRQRLTQYHQRCHELDITTRRLRIIETPITPYLQWELHLLHLRDTTGGPVRILPAHKIAEKPHPHPDYNVIAPDIMYKVSYDHHGVLQTATAYTHPAAIKNMVRYISGLYSRAEPINNYFTREIAHLPPPKPDQPLPDHYLDTTGRPTPPRT